MSISIPKTLVNDTSALRVYLDGSPITYTASQQDDSLLITITYHHSAHQVTINLSALATSDNQFNGEWIIIGAILAIVIAVALVLAVFRQMKKIDIPNR